jgi:uncharacterized protein YjiS (DUF1127 family)
MFAIDHDKVEYSTSSVLPQIGRGVVAPLMFIWRWLGLGLVVHWVQDEMARAALVDELSRLDDHYLRDIGIHRADIDDMADEIVRRRRRSRAS